MDIGKVIRSKRLEMNSTQQELADNIFVTRQTISKWELGKSEPDPISLKILEQVLDVSFAEKKLTEPRRSDRNMKSLYNILGTLLFGILFFPLRFIWVKLSNNWNSPIIRYAVIPAFLLSYLWYMHSLITNVFYFFLVLSLALYLIIIFYFYEPRKSNNKKNN